MSNEDGTALLNFNILKDGKLKIAINQFWNNLLKSCNQLQENEIQPIAFLQSESLGLIGIIQQVCFYKQTTLILESFYDIFSTRSAYESYL